MKLIAVTVAALSVAIALPVVADAGHKPGHQGGTGYPQPAPGGGGGGGTQAQLSLGAAPNPIVFGRGTLLSGRLKGPNHGGRTVILDGARHPFTSFKNNIATAVTTAGGDYVFNRRPRLHTRYRVRVGGVLSPTVTVLVRQRVSLRLSDRTPRRGQVVRFSGRSCPTHDGAVVSIQKRTSTGGWRTVRRTTLRDASRCSVYSRRLRIYRDGTFRSVVARDADHARGFSRRRFADAHR